MKKTFMLLVIVAVNSFVYPQVSLRAGLGLNFISTPSLRDYLNVNFAPPDNQVASFGSAVNFSAEADFRVAKNYEVGMELAYLYNSYNYSPFGGRYELAYGIIMPTITNYYVIDGPGYNFKFGGGIGIRLTSVNETLPFTSAPTKYSSTGFGILLRAMGNTALSSVVYANITGDIRYDINGEPKNNGNPIMNNVLGNQVNLNSFSLGLTLGITYIF
jgi:hypothetical protein